MQSLQKLQDLKRFPSLKPLTVSKEKRVKHLSQFDLLLYSTNLCLFSMRILRDEITVPNRSMTLNTTAKEIDKLRRLILNPDDMLLNNYTKKDTKQFFKQVGLKPKHIKH